MSKPWSNITRFTRTPIAWMVGGVLVALPSLALPAGEVRQDIPITDPVLLESLGFEPDATNVYATPPGRSTSC